MSMPLQTKLALLAAVAVIAVAISAVPHPWQDGAGCDTDTDCMEKFCMRPGEPCDGGPEQARP